MKSVTKIALLGVSLSALATPYHAIAQDTAQEASEASADEIIIVQARRRDESIQDVPAVVNAVTAADVADLNLRSFNDVQSLVPGLSLSNNANGIGGNAQIRGVNFDINASGNNPTVEFYQNDAPITAGVVLQQMYDIGQIEVLRGPQGTLRGRASPSGSITITTRKPDLYEMGGSVSATANDIGTQNVNAAFGTPVIDGILGIRVAGLYDVNDGDRVRPLTNGVDGRDPYSRTRSGRISVLFQPTESINLEGSYQIMSRRLRSFTQAESFSEVNPAAPASPVLIRAEDRLSISESPFVISQRFETFNGQASFAFAGQKLIYVGQHYTQRISSRQNDDRANSLPNFDFYQNTATRVKSTSHEIRLQNEERVFDMFDYVIGVFDNKNDTPTNLNIETPIFLPAFLGGGRVAINNTAVQRLGDSHEQSVFGNLTLHIGDSTQVSGGLRYIDYEDQGQLLVGGNLIATNGQKENKLIYTASIQHKFTPDIMVYASTGSSWRPGISVVGDFSVVKSALQNSFLNLTPETSKSYEAGIKTTLFGGRGQFNLSAYHQTFKGYPFRAPGNGIFYLNYAASRDSMGNVTVTPTSTAFNFVAAVPVEVNGVEAELNYAVTDNWDIGLVASYSLGKIKNGLIPCNDLDGDGTPDTITAAPTVAQLLAAYGANNLAGCRVNQRSSFNAPFGATVTTEYRAPISNSVDAFGRALFSYNGASQADPTSQFDDVSDFGILNLYAGVRGAEGDWEVTLFAKNILDTTKVTARTNPLTTTVQVLQPPTFMSAAAQTTTSSYTGVTTNAPREFGVTARFSFGGG